MSWFWEPSLLIAGKYSVFHLLFLLWIDKQEVTLRIVNSYRKVSINNLELRVPKAPLHERIQLRIVPDKESALSEVKFWHEDELLGIQKLKILNLI